MPRPALSATRATDLLNFLAAHPGQVFSYSELSRRLEINLSSMHSVLVALTECGYLSRDPARRTYGLGPVLVALADAALECNPAIDRARIQMRSLAAELEVEALTFVRAGSDTLCVARAGEPLGAGVRVGQRVPLIAPLASVFLAWAGADEIERWILRAGATRRERRLHLGILEVVRERGYSVALEVEGRRRIGDLLTALAEDPHDETLGAEMRDQIAELGHGRYQFEPAGRPAYSISTITAPVFDPEGDVGLSLTLQGFAQRLSATAIGRMGKRLLAVAREIAPAP